MRTPVTYPHIRLRLVGTDGNAFAILGKLQQALRRAGVPAEAIAQVMAEAQSGDYNHLLQTVCRTVEVE